MHSISEPLNELANLTSRLEEQKARLGADGLRQHCPDFSDRIADVERVLSAGLAMFPDIPPRELLAALDEAVEVVALPRMRAIVAQLEDAPAP